MPYTVHQAKTHFSKILKEVEAGQEVVVMRGKKPVAKIVAIDPPSSAEDTDVLSRRRLTGSLAGKITWSDDAFDPMTDEELRGWGMDYLADAPLVKPEAGPKPSSGFQ